MGENKEREVGKWEGEKMRGKELINEGKIA